MIKETIVGDGSETRFVKVRMVETPTPAPLVLQTEIVVIDGVKIVRRTNEGSRP